MKTIGIKLADGSFYPVMEEGSSCQKTLDLTTAHNNQTCVMVDMYRSESCTMDDAEYIDTLKIDNLNAHLNGEPDISFSVGLDEDGKLSANISDKETGASSHSDITLVSRTIEERFQADDYTISHSAESIFEEFEANENNNAEDSDKTIEQDFEEPTQEDAVVEDEDELNHKEAVAVAGVAAGVGLLAAAAAFREKDEETAPESESFTEDNTFTEDNIFAEDPAVEEPSADDFISDETFVEEPVFEETPSAESSEESSFNEVPSDETITDDSSFDDFSSDVTISDDNPFGDISSDDTIADDKSFDEQPVEENFSDDFGSFDSNDFEIPGNEPAIEDSFAETSSYNGDYDLPDFPAEEESFSTNLDDDDFSLDDKEDFSFDNYESNGMDNQDDGDVQKGGISFTGLYDKETEMGESGAHDDDSADKKTKKPVIICVVCAIICLLATFLLLFIIPSKYNLIQKKPAEAKDTIEVVKQEEEKTPVAEETPAPSVPAAKEEEVVIIEEAEEVIPEPPAPAVKEEKSKQVVYKIKWGDTLWDIADTYYKNPWKYKYIARYNGIKNPDHIISGKTIIIPE